MEEYDLIVAGGGPAGLSAARTAAEGGARVLLVERETAFGIPTRTSGGSFVDDMRALGVPERLWTPMHHVVFLAPHTSARLDYPRAAACVLDVRALYQWLAERAAAAGAELRLRTTVTGVSVGGGAVTLTARAPGGERRVRARHAVDATGTASVLAIATGMYRPYARRAVGAELDLHAPDVPPDTCWLIVGEQVAPRGYAWVFPYRPGRVRVGVGVMRPDTDADPRPLLERVLRLPELEPVLRRAQPVETHAGIIPVEPLRTAIVRNGVVCVGDAASHASTLVGEGIRYAMRAGDAAGRAVAEAVAGGGEAPLRAFERTWSREHRRDFAVAYRINRALTAFDDRRWDRAVDAIAHTPPWFVAEALRSRFRAAALARLALRHPGLARRYAAAAAGR